MRLILKTLWKNRKQNGWIFAEIALITALSWFMVDYLVVTQYSTHFCTPAGEFEKDHLCVGMFGILQNENETERQISTDEEAIGVYAIKNKLASLPEVQSVCLTTNYLGGDLRLYSWRTLSLIDDTTKTIGVAQQFYIPNQQYFETQGLQAIEGSPDVETLSRDIPEDGIVITRSVAKMLFGTDQVVGKQVAMVDYALVQGDLRDMEVVAHYTIVGVVEDVKAAPAERYPYTVFFPIYGGLGKLLLRLKPDVDAEAFVAKLQPTLFTDFQADGYVLAQLETYNQHYENQLAHDQNRYFTQLASVPLVLFAINVIIGTLGTFWLQIRKRKEDIGIMRAFGASKRRIFATLLSEGAILTLLATMFGDFIWLQVTASWDVLSDGNAYGASGRETDWVTLFWPHFLIISFIVFLLVLIVVSIGIALPAWRVCRQKIVEALRDE